MERWLPQSGTTGNDIDTRERRRTLVRNQTWTGSDNTGSGQERSPFTNAPWLASDPRIPARLTRTASIDEGLGTTGNAATNTHNARSSHRTDSERTIDSDIFDSPDVGTNRPVFPSDPNSSQDLGVTPEMDASNMGEVAWRSRMSEYVSGLPNFALGSVTRDYTQKRRRLFSDKSQYHDVVSMEKHSRRYRKGTMSSSGSDWSTDYEFIKQDSGSSLSQDDYSTFSRLSSCSSHDSIQHWVDSLDDNDNDVTVISGHHHGNETGISQNRGPNHADITQGYGQQSQHKERRGSDDLVLGAEAHHRDSDVTPKRSRVVGPGGRVLQRTLTNSQIIEQAQQHRTLQGRRQQLLHMGGSGVSDTPSDYSVRTASSISELLWMRNDPEEILLSLGFGGSKRDDHLDRIPNRFLQHSRMKGISVPEFLHRMEEIERGYGFNTNGGLRGLEFVLDRQRSTSTYSLVNQSSVDEPDGDEIDQEGGVAVDKMGGVASDQETQRDWQGPPQPQRVLNRWDSSIESGPLSSRGSYESDSSYDLISRNSSLDATLKLIKDCDDTKDVQSSEGSDVFHGSMEKSHDSKAQDSVNVNTLSEGQSDRNGNISGNTLSEEQRNRIREELMLRAQIVRARMMIPEPQLAPVDEESESGSRSPYRAGSLDTVMSDERLPDGRKSSATSEEDAQDDRHKSPNVRTMSTPELDMYYGRTQKKSPPNGGKRTISPSAVKKEVKGQKVRGQNSPVHGDDENKLKPTSHKVAERLLKDAGHTGGGQESFEIEEISSTENQEENGSPANKQGDKPSEHGTLSRNPSTQSDSSGFADEGDAPTNGSNGNHSNDSPGNHKQKDNSATMTTTEVQTSFDTVRLDSYDQESANCSMDSSYVSPEDVRRVTERRESFRKSHGTSIITSATFSSIGFDDDDAFLVDDVLCDEETLCGRNTPVEGLDVFQHEQEAKPRPLRRSGTFPTMASHLQTDSLLRDKRKRLVSSQRFSVDLQRYDDLQYSSLPSPDNVDRKEFSSGRDYHDLSEHNTMQTDLNLSQIDTPLLPVCEDVIVPSNSTDTVTQTAQPSGKSSNDPVHIEHNQSLTKQINESIPQYTTNPTHAASWGASNLSQSSQNTSSLSRSLVLEPSQSHSPVFSPPPSLLEEIEQADSSKMVLPGTKDSNPHPRRKDSNPHPGKKDSNQHPGTEDSNQHPGKKVSNQHPGTEDSGQYPESKDSNPHPHFKDSNPHPESKDSNWFLGTNDSNPHGGSGVWQVMEKAHHLQQYRRSQSQQPASVCTSELNARCEPVGASSESDEGNMRSSLELDIVGSDGANAAGLPKETRHKRGSATRFTESDEAEDWQGVLAASTPMRKVPLPSRTLSEYETEDVQVLQKALDKYKGDLASLEATSKHIYNSVETEITENDRCELEALGCVRRQIMGEIATMENLLAKKLQFIASEKEASVVSDEAELLAASTENMDIIKEMIGLLEEQRSMQHFLQDLGSQTQALDESRKPAPEDLSAIRGDVLVQELLDVKRELVEYRALAKQELQVAISELKHSLMAEIRREFAQDTNNIHLQLQAKDDEIRRLRALLGETDHIDHMISQPSPRQHNKVEETKDELKQLKELLLKKNPRKCNGGDESNCLEKGDKR